MYGIGWSLDRREVERLDTIASGRPDIVAHYLAAIVDSSDDAILSKDLNGIIRSWNAAAERLFGYTAAEAVGQPVTMLMPADRQGEQVLILERLKGGERVHFETLHVRKDGSTVPISLTISPVRSSEGQVIGASHIARDISERVQAQERQHFLVRELHHRTQNLFSVLQFVARSTLKAPLSLAGAAKLFESRLRALAETHRLLADAAWQGAQLSQIIQRELAPFASHLSITGSDIVVHTLAAQQFALTVHELATNSLKYGALSTPSGRVAIAMNVEQANNPILVFVERNRWPQGLETEAQGIWHRNPVRWCQAIRGARRSRLRTGWIEVRGSLSSEHNRGQCYRRMILLPPCVESWPEQPTSQPTCAMQYGKDEQHV
jgi:PAS domain S-box-containing protein